MDGCTDRRTHRYSDQFWFSLSSRDCITSGIINPKQHGWGGGGGTGGLQRVRWQKIPYLLDSTYNTYNGPTQWDFRGSDGRKFPISSIPPITDLHSGTLGGPMAENSIKGFLLSFMTLCLQPTHHHQQLFLLLIFSKFNQYSSLDVKIRISYQTSQSMIYFIFFFIACCIPSLMQFTFLFFLMEFHLTLMPLRE